MSILTGRPEKPFWRVVPQEGIERNPLGHSVASNQATPDYVADDDVLSFAAYAFICCWLDPEEFVLWPYVVEEDIQWLREYFLRRLEAIALNIYEGNLQPGAKSSDFDWGNYESLTVADSDDEEEETEAVMLTWAPQQIDEESVAFLLDCRVDKTVDGKWSSNDPEVIYVRLDALRDRQWVRLVIDFARQINHFGFGFQANQDEAWDALGVAKLIWHYNQYIADFRPSEQWPKPDDLRQWYSRLPPVFTVEPIPLPFQTASQE